MKLINKVRVGSRLTRQYDTAQTPLDRLLHQQPVDDQSLLSLQHLRTTLDPFVLAKCIDQKLERIWTLTNQRLSPK